jgi:pimeloyl-ACP methyl ester carboxylesterase
MFKKISVTIFAIFISLTLSLRAHAGVGPIDTTGEINGAPYRIAIPENWNGILLVYGHGYRDKADHPGEVDNRNADIAPNSALANALLAQGYALAGSAYRDNGWEIEGGIHDLKDLTVYFRDTYGQPDKTILWAFSMGTYIAFESMERFGGIYDGALCGCAGGAGSTQSWDAAGDLALAYDTVFGMPGSWGNVGDVRDTIDFETEVQPKLVTEVTNPANFPKFEFLRLVAGTPGRGITPPAPPAFYPGWVFTDMFFTMEARSELERRAGGPIVQNLDRDYNLTAAERTYLMGLGIPGAVIDGWLLQMNNSRIFEAPKFSRNYVEHYANYTGRIKHPILTMHTVIDPLITVAQEHEYAETIATAGRTRLLKQVYTNGVGHCNFTGPQLLTAVGSIRSWVETGMKPADSNFPSALGFVPGFVPPPMNQP